MATETIEQKTKRLRDGMFSIPGSRWSGNTEQPDGLVMIVGDTTMLLKADYAQVLELERIANALEKLVDK